MLLDIVKGMNYLHSLHILHRDIKPENILLHWGDNKGMLYAKICDFGTARKTSPTVENKTLEGTMDYLPPEILDKICIDFHSLMLDPEKGHLLEYRKSGDVYAFGVTTWEFLSEQKFLVDYSLEEMKREILSGRRQPLPSHLPQWCQSMLDDCWAHKQEERLSFDDLKVQLQSKVKVYGRHLTDARTSYTANETKYAAPNLLDSPSQKWDGQRKKSSTERSFFNKKITSEYWKRSSSSRVNLIDPIMKDNDQELFNENNTFNSLQHVSSSERMSNLLEQELVGEPERFSFDGALQSPERRRAGRSRKSKSPEKKLPRIASDVKAIPISLLFSDQHLSNKLAKLSTRRTESLV